VREVGSNLHRVSVCLLGISDPMSGGGHRSTGCRGNGPGFRVGNGDSTPTTTRDSHPWR
jgi:hypothetical protein